MRISTALAAVVALAFAAVPAALAAPPDRADGPAISDVNKYCPPGQLVVNVSQTVVNAADSGKLGNAWAFEGYTRQIQILRTGPNTYCGGTRYTGTFTTNAGPSPGGGGIVGPGITGSIAGGYRTTNFKAVFVPSAPTSGYIGLFDYQCDLTLNCPGYVNWTTLYFKNVQGFGLARWEWIYTTPANGAWFDTYLGYFGDITGV